MNAEQAMVVSIGEIQQGILQQEIEQANALKCRVEDMVSRFFDRTDKKQANAEFKIVATELTAFEKNIINHEILAYMYAIIARVHLHTHSLLETISYAKAGIELNEKNGDMEGVESNARVLLDMACMLSAKDAAIEVVRRYPVLDDGNILSILQFSSNLDKSNAVFNAAWKASNPPDSLKICLDKSLTQDERVIRSLMMQMGISREAAIKYTRM